MLYRTLEAGSQELEDGVGFGGWSIWFPVSCCVEIAELVL